MIGDDRQGESTQPGGLQRFAPAHEEFMARLRTAWPAGDPARTMEEAYSAFARILQEPWESAERRQRATDAYAAWAESVREAFAGRGSVQVLDAYCEYLSEIARAWAAMEPGTITPAELGTIAQGLSWVAMVCSHVVPPLGTAVDPGSRE